MADIIEKNIKVSGCDVYILEAGNRDKRAIILLHGMKFQAETWRELGTLRSLADSGFHVLAVDLPGFGKSPAGSAQPGEVLTAVIEEYGLKEPVLLGPSMGGRVSLEFCLDHPDQLGALVLVGPVGVPENREKLGGINIPVLAIWGEMDTISPLENGRILQEEISGCRLVIIDGAPHPCYLDNADIFHLEVNNFVNEV